MIKFWIFFLNLFTNHYYLKNLVIYLCCIRVTSTSKSLSIFLRIPIHKYAWCNENCLLGVAIA